MNSAKITITPYQPLYEQTHIAFASRYWTKGRRKNPDYIYWKFRGTPGKKMPSFLLALAGDTVIGQLGLVPCDVMIAGMRYDAQWACDLMVDTAFRGKAVAKMLYEEAHRQKSITLGSDPSPAAMASMTRAGYQALKGPVKYILPISIGETIRIKFPQFPLLKKTASPWLWHLKGKGKPHAAEIISAHWQDCIEAINTHRRQLPAPYVLHDAAFMQWRAEPFAQYYEAPFFLRHQDQESCMCFKRAGNAFYVNEWHAASPGIMAAFLRHLIENARAAGVHFIHVPANSEAEEKMLKSLGLFRFKTPTNIIYHCGGLERDPLAGYGRFYYTYWDSDEYI